MNKIKIGILILGFWLSGCNVLKSNKDVIADYSKLVAEKTLKNVFGSKKLVFEKDSINIDAIITKEHA